MKYLIITALLFTNYVNADSSGLPDCKPAPVVRKKKVVRKPKPPVAPIVVEKVITKYVAVEKDNTKQNIISLYAQRKITGLDVSTSKSAGTAKATVNSESLIVPGISYQRITDSGLVIGAGIDTLADVMVQVGIGF